MKGITSSQRKASLTEETPPYLPGTPGREPCSACSHVIGEQNARQIGNPAIPLTGTSARGDKSWAERGAAGVMLPRGASQSPFSGGTQGGPQTEGLGSLATRDCPAATAWG